MIILTDEEIKNASNIIDKNLEKLNDDNRGEISTNILNAIRNLNDNIAYKIWNDKFPDKPMSINKVASKFTSVSGCQFIAQFDKCMRKSLSHFTPSEEGSIFLLSKYYKYIYQLKQVMKEIYNIDIIKNIDLYYENKIDKQTLDYYTKIASAVDISKEDFSDMDIFYISSSRPFRIDNKLYYEVVLEPAEEVSNKFNRITAFTKFDIDTNYAVSLQFSNKNIDLLDKKFPIKVITKWKISIRPCELINFGDLIDCEIKIQRGYPEYQLLMDILTKYKIDLLDIIQLNNDDYSQLKTKFEGETKNNHSRIFDLLDFCKDIILGKKEGQNILRYLLVTMNNRIIKLQRQKYSDTNYANCNISSKCIPFDKMPLTFGLRKHNADFYTLLNCIDLTKMEPDLFAHHIISSAEQNSSIFIPMSDLQSYGDEKQIRELVRLYNNKLDSYFKPTSELKIYQDKVYFNEHALSSNEIITDLKALSAKKFHLSNCFEQEKIDLLKDCYIINLGRCPKDGIYAKAVVYFVISKIYDICEQLPPQASNKERYEIRHFTIVDEAHYMLKFDNQPLQDLIKVGRSKGMSVILATQNMSDFKTRKFDFFANVQYPMIMLQQSQNDAVLKDLFGVSGNALQELKNTISTLQKGEVIIKDTNQDLLGLGCDNNYKKIKVTHLI